MTRGVFLSFGEFKRCAIEIYGNQYAYDQKKWRGAANPFSIWCRKLAHEPFDCYPGNHIGPHRQECRKCKRNRRERGLVLGSVYLLVAKSPAFGSLANFGRTEWLADRIKSHCMSDGVAYKLALRIDGLTIDEQKRFEESILELCQKRRIARRPKRSEVFIIERIAAEKLFCSVARKMKLSRRLITGALRK